MRIKELIFFIVCGVITLLLVFFLFKPALISLELLTIVVAILLGVNSLKTLAFNDNIHNN